MLKEIVMFVMFFVFVMLKWDKIKINIMHTDKQQDLSTQET